MYAYPSAIISIIPKCCISIPVTPMHLSHLRALGLLGYNSTIMTLVHHSKNSHLLFRQLKSVEISVLLDSVGVVALGVGDESHLQDPADQNLGNGDVVCIRNLLESGVVEVLSASDGTVGFYIDTVGSTVLGDRTLLALDVELEDVSRVVIGERIGVPYLDLVGCRHDVRESLDLLDVCNTAI
jgi:hypothetical protein